MSDDMSYTARVIACSHTSPTHWNTLQVEWRADRGDLTVTYRRHAWDEWRVVYTTVNGGIAYADKWEREQHAYLWE